MTSPAPLPVLKIILGAPVLLWWHLPSLLRKLAAPLVLLVFVSLAPALVPSVHVAQSFFLISLAYLFGMTIISIGIHRQILSGGADTNYRAYHWGAREWRFLANTFFVYLIFAACTTLVLIFSATTGLIALPTIDAEGNVPATSSAFQQMLPLLAIPGTYVLARLSVIFPATALEHPLSLSESWHMTRGNGLRLFLIIGVVPWLFSQFIGLILSESPSLIERVLIQVLVFAIWALEIVALSLSYQDLQPATRKTDDHSPDDHTPHDGGSHHD